MDFGRVVRQVGLGVGMALSPIVPFGHASAQTAVPAQFQVLAPAASQREDAQRPAPSERIDTRSRPVLVGEWRDFSLLRAVIPERWFPLASGLTDMAARAEVEAEAPRNREQSRQETVAAATESIDSAPSDAERADCAARLAGTMEEGSITFASGGSTITAESEAVLSAVADILQACSAEQLYVEGHTDSVGDPTSNLALSVARAEAVVDGLMELGISPSRLFALGYGASLPVADNDTPDGRQANRRIVLSFEDAAVPQ